MILFNGKGILKEKSIVDSKTMSQRERERERERERGRA
jgi:hypothetical protein